MKKLISLLLAVLIIMLCFAPGAAAMSYTAGVNALNTQFIHGDDLLDYVYYSPVKGEKDDTKYPLVVWLHGNSSGDYPGHQIENCDISLWSSEEYQRRFKGTGGAFLFMPRYPTNAITIAWEGPTTTLKSSIDRFLKANEKHIDPNRIYIGGYSMGGKMVLRMASTYPEFFAAAFPLSPVYAPTTMELNSLVDMPIWFAWCKNDTYVSLNPITVLSNWEYLMALSNCREDCRLVTFDTIYHSDYRIRTADGKNDTHNTWDAATRDFFMDDGAPFKDVKITDGKGKEVPLNYPEGLISWLSSQGLTEDDASFKPGSLISKLLSKMFGFFGDFFVSLVKILTDAL